MRLFPDVDGTIGQADTTFLLSESWDLIINALAPQAQVGGPDWGWTADKVAIVWDPNNANSVTIKNYILSQWPWLADAVLCPINCATILTGQDGFETVSQANFTATIAPPITALASTVRQLIVCYGMPTRLAEAASDSGNQGHLSVSVQMSRLGGTGSTFYDNGSRDARWLPSTAADYPGTMRTVNYIDGPSVPAVQNYVDKVRDAHPGGSQLFIYDNRRFGQRFILDDNRANGTASPFIDYRPFPKAAGYRTALLAQDADATIEYALDDTTVIQDVAAAKFVQTWGTHSDDLPDPMSVGAWMSGGANGMRMSGLSSFCLLTTMDSFNGRRGSSFNGIAYCYKADAFGGSNYEFTPIGFVAATEEQTVSGAPYQNLAAHWQRGWGLNEVAWANRTTEHFVVFGYPFVSGGVHINRLMEVAQRLVPGHRIEPSIYPGVMTSPRLVPGVMVQTEQT